MKISIVLSTQAASFEAATFQGDLEDNLASIARLGYDGVELAIRDPGLVDADALLEAVGRHDLNISAVGTGQAWGEEGLSFVDPDPAVREAAIERIESHLPFAARAEAVVILGLIRGTLVPGMDPDQAMDDLVSALQRCGTRAAELGVRLALEPIRADETRLINTVEQALVLVERVERESFGLLLDTYHMHIEEPDILQGIRRASGRIFHFHVADSNRQYPGAGELDFPALLGVLRDTGYDGWVSGEFLPRPDVHTAAKEAIGLLRGIIGGL